MSHFINDVLSPCFIKLVAEQIDYYNSYELSKTTAYNFGKSFYKIFIAMMLN